MQEKKIAFYARKSKITTSGNSIDQQIDLCKRYAVSKFLAAEEDFLIYVDEGLSGFYSDRPQYQKMIADIQSGLIKAVICYKIDRISRKTTELLNFIEALKADGIAFIACSDEIDTESKTGKMMLSLLASVAEFERDMIAERISDNMLSLAKDGRWLGGVCPTGYTAKKEYVMQRGKKSVVHHLQLEEETAFLVCKIYETFLANCSLTQTVENLNQKGYRTVQNKRFERHGVKNILQNPVYAKADQTVYDYLQSQSIPVLEAKEAFDGTHGLMVYNKTRQEKVKNKEKGTYRQRLTRRAKADWVVALGKHSGLVCGNDWVLTQEILLQNQNKFYRMHETTDALFAGKIHCSECGSIMYVRAQSGRQMQDGSPCFYYVCSRKHKDHHLCPQSPNLNGNTFDPWLVNQIFEPDWINQLHKKVLLRFVQQQETDCGDSKQNRMETTLTYLEKTIQMQIVNLRNAPEEIKKYIYEDLQQMQQKIAQLQIEKNGQKAEQNKQKKERIVPERLASQFMNLKELFESAPLEKKRLFLNQLLSRIELSDGRILITM